MRAVLGILLLLGAAGAIFVAGWIQILLPPATYAVLFSKTGGLDPRVIPAGTFAWRWERVIPTNVTLFRFEVQPATVETSVRADLPSADAVAGMLPDAANLGYAATVSVTFAVRPGALPQLVADTGLTPERLPEWTAAAGAEVAAAALELLQRRGAAVVTQGLAAAEAELLDRLAARFPSLELLGIRVTDLRLPDLEIYERGRQAYLALLDVQYEARRAAVVDLAHERERERAVLEARLGALEVLREYGALLQEYPGLIQFLELQSDAGRDALLQLAEPVAEPAAEPAAEPVAAAEPAGAAEPAAPAGGP